MENNQVNIDKITADLEKKYNGDPDHDVAVIQQYCSTLPPCDASARLVAALGKYASQKFPTAKAFVLARKIDEAIANLEKEFTGDAEHDIKTVQDYCKNLPQSEESFRITMALGQYVAAKYPDAESIKKSREEYKKMTEKAGQLKSEVEGLQKMIENKEIDRAIETIQKILSENELPKDTNARLVSFSHPLEELLFREHIKETRPMMRISNLPEMLNLQLGSLLAQKEQYEEARSAIEKSIELNPVSMPAHIELAHIAIREKNYDEAFNILQRAYPFIYSKQMISLYFCFLATVVENLDKNYILAASYAHLSLEYSDNPLAHEVIERLAKEHNIDTKQPDAEEFFKCAQEADLPIEPDPAISALAVKAAKDIKSAHPAIAKEFLQIAADLTGNNDLLKEI